VSKLKNLVIPGRTPLVREDFGFMDPAQAATLEMAPRWASVGLLTVVALFLSLAVWAYFWRYAGRGSGAPDGAAGQ
jgi:hypothetical protein